MRQIIIVMAIVLSMTACRSVPQVPVIHDDKTHISDNDEKHSEHTTDRDTVIVRDSIVIREKGDTTYIERWHTLYQDRWHETIKIDSVYCFNTDSVYIEKPVYIERKMSWWEKTKASVGLALFWFAMAILGYLIFRYII